jgi:D-3-phosphoglycerate dehydrogenase / 2-oxoglutarate reductase
MKIAVIDDYQGAFEKTKAFPKLQGHDVAVYTDTQKDPAKLAERLKDAEAVVLTQQRSPFPRVVIEKLPKLKMISQTGKNAYHIDR